MGLTRRVIDRSIPDDTVRLFEWANDPDTRANSFHMAPVQWWSHMRFMDDTERYTQIVELDGEPLAVVRINSDNEVSITIAPEHRGKGHASEILSGLPTNGGLIAKIKPDNERSLRAFTKAGFVVDHIVMRHE